MHLVLFFLPPSAAHALTPLAKKQIDALLPYT